MGRVTDFAVWLNTALPISLYGWAPGKAFTSTVRQSKICESSPHGIPLSEAENQPFLPSIPECVLFKTCLFYAFEGS